MSFGKKPKKNKERNRPLELHEQKCPKGGKHKVVRYNSGDGMTKCTKCGTTGW